MQSVRGIKFQDFFFKFYLRHRVVDRAGLYRSTEMTRRSSSSQRQWRLDTFLPGSLSPLSFSFYVMCIQRHKSLNFNHKNALDIVTLRAGTAEAEGVEKSTFEHRKGAREAQKKKKM